MRMTPVIALFFFTIRRMLGDWKFWALAVAMLLPCILALIIRRFAPPADSLSAPWKLYHHMYQFMFLMGLLPMSCMIHGTGLIGSETETRTIGYLITRRLRRRAILLTRFAAAALVLAVLAAAATAAMHLAVVAGHDWEALAARAPNLRAWNPGDDLKVYLGVSSLGAVGFLAVFTLIGLLAAKPLVLGVSYLVVVEFIVANLPVGARTYSLLHPLRSMAVRANPKLVELFQLPPDLVPRVFPPGHSGFGEWCLIVAASLAIACILISRRELVPSKLARD